MLPIAFGVTWFGYGVTTWGYALIKGWDIPFGAWFSPFHPWDWKDNAKSPPLIPPTQINPSSDVKPVNVPASA